MTDAIDFLTTIKENYLIFQPKALVVSGFQYTCFQIKQSVI